MRTVYRNPAGRSSHRLAPAAVLIAFLVGLLAYAGPAAADDSAATVPGDAPLSSYPGTVVTDTSSALADVSTTPIPCDDNGDDKALTRTHGADAGEELAQRGIPYTRPFQDHEVRQDLAKISPERFRRRPPLPRGAGRV